MHLKPYLIRVSRKCAGMRVTPNSRICLAIVVIDLNPLIVHGKGYVIAHSLLMRVYCLHACKYLILLNFNVFL